MIICHCKSITDRDIRAAVNWMRAADPDMLITPVRIYRALGKTAECGGCLAAFIDTMRICDSFEIPMQTRGSNRVPTQEAEYEGRQEGYRIPEQSA